MILGAYAVSLLVVERLFRVVKVIPWSSARRFQQDWLISSAAKRGATEFGGRTEE
jgi:hypothetical protein